MRARVFAPLVAAVLGLAGGVAAALVVPADDSDGRASTFNDPLHLGIPLVDQDCTGESLLVVGYGNSVAPLGTAVADVLDRFDVLVSAVGAKVRHPRTRANTG